MVFMRLLIMTMGYGFALVVAIRTFDCMVIDAMGVATALAGRTTVRRRNRSSSRFVSCHLRRRHGDDNTGDWSAADSSWLRAHSPS